MNGELTNNYNDIIEMIEQAKNRVNAYVNRELIELYLTIGAYVIINLSLMVGENKQ